MAELLIEILSEEIPARMQSRAAEDLKKIVVNSLHDIGLKFDPNSASSYVTPRRLALVVYGLASKIPDVNEERRGPRVDAPKKAIDGFLGSLGLTLADLEKRETEKGTFYFVQISKEGRQTNTVLKELLEDAISKLNWPKSMRWSSNTHRWVRPIHSLICIFDREVIPLRLGSCTAGRKTSAHRFLTNTLIEVNDFVDYKSTLETGYVMIDSNDRKAKIKSDIEDLASKESLKVVEDKALLDEVAGLVEWPVALMGSIDASFMDIPREVLTTTMRKNQKYFALITSEGILAPKFIMVTNKETPDGGASIIAGNERVLRSRLADAKFFWDKDLKTSLESRLPQLHSITFHTQLGTMGDKVDRVREIAVGLANTISTNKDQVARAAQLAKADLVTEMVTEFPEVQGIIGGYYALNDGEGKEVSQAIQEHYSPVGPSDFCPNNPISVAVSIADKVDTLVGFWAIDEKPTGSKDPYALRRSALGVIRLILENNLRLKLMDLFSQAWTIGDYSADKKSVLEGLVNFFDDRLIVHLREKGIRHDLITAGLAVKGESDITQLVESLEVLDEFLKTETGQNLLSAYKRAVNILRIEEKKDKRLYDNEDSIDDKLIHDENELSLVKNLRDIVPKVKSALDVDDYDHAMSLLATLRKFVDAFFDSVTVNSDDPLVRVNRLKILGFIRSSFNQIADFSQIEGGER